MKNNSKRKVNVFAIIVFVVLILYAISIFFVLGWGLLTSLKTYAEFRMRPNKNVLGLPDVAWNINYIQELASAGFPVEAYSIFNNYQKFSEGLFSCSYHHSLILFRLFLFANRQHYAAHLETYQCGIELSNQIIFYLSYNY